MNFIMSFQPTIPMITYATVGTKWQIVIPKEARDKIRVNPWDKVVLVIEDGKMMILNPQDVQTMIQLLQEGIEVEEKKKDKKKKK
jgi:AbrB family looped-hinge helix DNA binding protein